MAVAFEGQLTWLIFCVIISTSEHARKGIETMNTYQFTVIIERQPEGGYLVSVPALPGCYTEPWKKPAKWLPTLSVPTAPACANMVNRSLLSPPKSS